MYSFLAVLVCLIIAIQPVYGGEISGTVRVSLNAPDPRTPISPFAHSRGGNLRQRPVDASQSVVYLSESASLPVGNPPTESPVMDQRNLTIIPHILPILIGTTVRFPNSDALYHNLFSLSPARKFDLGRYPKGISRTVTFEKPGEVHIFCDIHPTMSSIILVLPNQYFCRTDKAGNFRLAEVPAGNWTINAWHEQLNDVSAEVVVPENGIVNLDLNLSE